MKSTTCNIILAFAALLLTVCSCRQDCDEVGYINGEGMGERSSKTYTEKWDVLWKAYNQNYVAWDIETVDWDAQNAKYRPLFQELDRLVDNLKKAKTTNNDSLKAVSERAHQLYTEALDTLHDGHTYVEYDDYAQPSKRTYVYPGENRRAKYDDIYDKVSRFEKHYYINNQEIVKYDYLSPGSMLKHFLTEKYIPLMMEDVTEVTQDESASNDTTLEFCNAIESAINSRTYDEPEDYEAFLEDYQELMEDPAFKELADWYGCAIDDEFDETCTGVETFVTKDGIAGYRLKRFDLPAKLDPPYANDINGDVAKYVHDKLFEWRDTVYSMHDNGTLKGVVLDVRSNGGGQTANLGYFSGLLFKGSQYPFGTTRQKNGIGRLDYTVPRDKAFTCPANNSEDITEPIVILTDANSVSCAEVSTAAVKQHNNGVSIGTRTFGAGCLLWDNCNFNSTFGYTGNIGERGVTPVYAYIPNDLSIYYKFGVIDGRGISPDIELRFDNDLYEQTGRDNQFERALQYIRTGK